MHIIGHLHSCMKESKMCLLLTLENELYQIILCIRFLILPPYTKIK
jgi:hypothetical protein